MTVWTPLPTPGDTVADLKFGPGNLLSCASWDGSITLIDAAMPGKCNVQHQTQAPVISCAWTADNCSRLIFGGASRRLSSIQWHPDGSSWAEDIGPDFEGAVVGVSNTNALAKSTIGVSLDQKLTITDLRSEASSSVKIPGTPTDVDAMRCSAVVACTDGRTHIYDLRHLSAPVESISIRTNVPLKRVRCIPDGSGYAVSNLASRVAVTYLTPLQQSFVFKTNRIRTEGNYEAHAIYSLAFNPSSGQLAVGGSDRRTLIWDIKSQVRISEHVLPAAVTAMDWSTSGHLLAVATADDIWRLHPNKLKEAVATRILVAASADSII